MGVNTQSSVTGRRSPQLYSISRCVWLLINMLKQNTLSFDKPVLFLSYNLKRYFKWVLKVSRLPLISNGEIWLQQKWLDMNALCLFLFSFMATSLSNRTWCRITCELEHINGPSSRIILTSRIKYCYFSCWYICYCIDCRLCICRCMELSSFRIVAFLVLLFFFFNSLVRHFDYYDLEF